MSAHNAACGRNQIAVLEGRAAVASVALLIDGRPMASAEGGHDGAWPSRTIENIRRNAALVCFQYCDQQWLQPNGGTRSVASAIAREAATTERGPPEQLKTYAGTRPSTSPENIRAKRAEVPPYGSKMAYEAIGRWCRAVRLSAPSAPAL